MIWLCFVCIVVMLLGVLHIVRIHKELRHMQQQLQCIEEGSHITLTTQLHDHAFIEVYELLNRIQKKQEEIRYLYQTSEKELRDTITSLAHDLRTPLTSALGYQQMLVECKDSEKKEEYQEISLQRLQNLHELLESLFLYTKVRYQEYVEKSLENIYVYPILSTCMLDMYQEFEDNDMEVEVQFADENMQLLASKESLQRIFLNLLSNALVHGTGFLRVEQKKKSLVFANGLRDGAIPDPTQMFQRFYKADPARHQASSGLGLAIVKEFVVQLHGEIHAEILNKEIQIIIQF